MLGTWNNYTLGDKLKKSIEDNYFEINTDKIHFYPRFVRQSVTGLIVNNKVNVHRDFLQNLKAIIHDCRKNGIEVATEKHRNFYKHPDRSGGMPSINAIIEGKLRYLKMIRGVEDPVRLKLQHEYCAVNKDYKLVIEEEERRIKMRPFFISHASEDKVEVAIPLQEALRKYGLRVWLDKDEITLGDTFFSKINEGLANCRYGIVVLSKHFFKKNWANAELEALFSMQMDDGVKRVLPLWHDVDFDEIKRKYPLLTSTFAWNTNDCNSEQLAAKLNDLYKRKP